MPRRDQTELIRKKTAMSQTISSRDQDYALYAGAHPFYARKMALLDTVNEIDLFPKAFKPMLKFYRRLLDKERKAFLASTSQEITMLGFILGLQHGKVSGKGTRERLRKLSESSVQKTD